MTLDKGFEHFINSEKFKEISKQSDSEGGKLRGYKTRFLQGKLKEAAIAEILKKYGYQIFSAMCKAPK